MKNTFAKYLTAIALLISADAYARGVDSGGLRAMPVDKITVEGTKARFLLGVLKRSQVEYLQGFEGGYYKAGATTCSEKEGRALCKFAGGKEASEQDSLALVNILKKLDVAIYGEDEDGTMTYRLHHLDCASESVNMRLVQSCNFAFDAF